MLTNNEEDIKNITEKYTKIIENYKKYNKNVKNIYEDIKKLDSVHNVYINAADMSSMNYSIYVDDIKHQINITRLEYNYINDVYNMNIDKLYRDLFKLYNKITKLILTIYKDNKDIIIKIWKSSEKLEYDSVEFKKLKKIIRNLSDNSRSNNPMSNDNKIFDEIKKQYYYEIKIYNEICNNDNYSLDDIIKIYNNISKRLEELNLSKELIRLNLLDIQMKTEKGILGQAFIMDLNGKNDRIKVDYSIMLNLLNSTLDIHLTLAEKYNKISFMIAEQVNYDEDSITPMTTSTITIDDKKDDIFIDKNIDTNKLDD